MPVAIITGGAAGIGRHLCAGFAREGYVVAALDIQPMSSTHPDIHCFPCDLRDEADITSVFHTIAQTLGTPRVLINNGAVSRFRKPFPLLEAREFDDVLGTNLRGAFLCCREFVRLCRGTGYGRIINIASLQSSRAFPNGLPYGASKGGIAQLTRGMAEAWSRPGTGITANAIAPGFFKTQLTAPLFDKPEVVEALARQTTMNRVGFAEDIQGLTMFLASPASGYITGQVIHIDGGWTAI